MVIRLFAHIAVTPAGSPAEAPMPVAPMVVWVMFLSMERTQTVVVAGDIPTIFVKVTVILPFAEALLQLPNNGIT